MYNTVVVTEPTPTGLYTLSNAQIASHPFEVTDNDAALVEFYHSLHGQRQDFSVRVWFSNVANGPSLHVLPPALEAIHPLGQSYKFALYGDEADVTRTQTEWDVTFSDDPCFDLRIKRQPQREFAEHITVVTGRTGTHWINFHNLVGSDNGYFLEVKRTPLDQSPQLPQPDCSVV